LVHEEYLELLVGIHDGVIGVLEFELAPLGLILKDKEGVDYVYLLLGEFIQKMLRNENIVILLIKSNYLILEGIAEAAGGNKVEVGIHIV
jgi:hypothetical protein